MQNISKDLFHEICSHTPQYAKTVYMPQVCKSWNEHSITYRKDQNVDYKTLFVEKVKQGGKIESTKKLSFEISLSNSASSRENVNLIKHQSYPLYVYWKSKNDIAEMSKKHTYQAIRLPIIINAYLENANIYQSIKIDVTSKGEFEYGTHFKWKKMALTSNPHSPKLTKKEAEARLHATLLALNTELQTHIEDIKNLNLSFINSKEFKFTNKKEVFYYNKAGLITDNNAVDNYTLTLECKSYCQQCKRDECAEKVHTNALPFLKYSFDEHRLHSYKGALRASILSATINALSRQLGMKV